MGYALITSGGTDGRYSIQLDYGSANRTAVLAALNQLLAKLDTDIATLQVRIADAQSEIAQRKAALDQAIADQIASIQSGGAIDNASFQEARRYYAQTQGDLAPLERHLAALKFDRAAALRDIAKWTAFNPISTRDAWCVDFTEDGAGYVATLDVNGESDLVVLAPGCRAWQASDGVMTAREVQAPHQVYLNAALLPGWQKHRPTFRWGTITGINYDNDTADVALAAAASSAQSLPINQSSTLSSVPVTYMTCNAGAFEVDDRVVVQFLGNDWAQPRVIGFLDNPRPCMQFLGLYYAVNPPLAPISTVTLSTQLKYQNQTFETVTAPDPAQPVAFAGWTLQVSRYVNGIWIHDPVTIGPMTLSVNDGTVGQRNVTRRAYYNHGPALTVTGRLTSASWATLYQSPAPPYSWFGTLTATWVMESGVNPNKVTHDSGTVTSGEFQLNFGDQDPWNYTNRLTLPAITAELPTIVQDYAHHVTGVSFTFTLAPSGPDGGFYGPQDYLPTSVDRLMP